METKYKLAPSTPPATAASVAVRSDGVSFPFDPANTDYQAYLKWLEEGNEPTPADEAL